MRLFQSKPHLGVVLLGSWLIATGMLYLVGRARELSMVSQELAMVSPELAAAWQCLWPVISWKPKEKLYHEHIFTPELERFVHDQVVAGHYPTENDVVRDALEQLRRHAPSNSPAPAPSEPCTMMPICSTRSPRTSWKAAAHGR